MSRLLWLLPVVLLQACAGTPVAEQLERSFAVPEDSPVEVAAPAPSSQTITTADRAAERASEASSSPLSSDPTPASSVRPDPQDPSEPVAEVKSPPAVVQPQPKAPYRITIRLAGADPAAPAEAVTRALREADVGFAVERIERVEP